jgi:hypothetical protein
MWKRSQDSRKSATDRSPTTTGSGYWAPLLIAVALILAYLGYALLLYFSADQVKDDTHWNRLVYIAGGLSSLVSAALGWVFGREVHRSAVDNATKEAGRARDDAAAAKREADLGRALALAVKSVDDPSKLKGMAEQLFPPQSSAASSPPESTDVQGPPG